MPAPPRGCLRCAASALRVGSGSPFPGEGGGEVPSLSPGAGQWLVRRSGEVAVPRGCRTARAITALPGKGRPPWTGLLDRGDESWQQLCAG